MTESDSLVRRYPMTKTVRSACRHRIANSDQLGQVDCRSGVLVRENAVYAAHFVFDAFPSSPPHQLRWQQYVRIPLLFAERYAARYIGTPFFFRALTGELATPGCRAHHQ